MDYSYEEDQPTIGDNSMASLRDLALKQRKKELELAEAEAAVVRLKAELASIAEDQIPSLLDELGISNFKTEDGLKIEVKEIIRASMGRSEAEKARAFKWLEDNGHSALIKRTVEIPFKRTETDKADELQKRLMKEGLKAAFLKKIEPATLRSFITEKLREGEEVPLELFKVIRQRRAKVDIQ